MTSPRYEFGGGSQSLTRAPLDGFNTQIYGMVTHLAGLTTGTADAPRHD